MAYYLSYCNYQANLYYYIRIMEQPEVVIVREQIREEVRYEGDIRIEVEGPQLNLNQTIKYYSYQLKGVDSNGQFSIRRRYKDFDLLRRKLSQRWLGIYMPPISGKRSQNNPLYIFKMFQKENVSQQIKYAQSRMRLLNYFCQGIAARPYLFYCDLFQMFIRGGPDYQTSIYGCIIKEYSFILNAYEANIKLMLNTTHQAELSAIISNNEQYFTQLRDSENRLQVIANQICKSIQTKEEYQNQLYLCLGTVLPSYEEKIYINTVDRQKERLIFNRSEDYMNKYIQFQQATSDNPLELLFQLILYEIRETKAFLEAIEGRRSAQRRKRELNNSIEQTMKEKIKLQNNEFSFRGLFKTGSKDLQIKQLQMKVQILKNEKYCFEKIIVIMVQNSNFEIEKYKQKRGKYYKQLFGRLANKEIAHINIYNQLLDIPLALLA